MNCHNKILLIAWLALIMVCSFGTATGPASPESQGKEAAAQEQAPDIGYTQEEYDAYTAAAKEPDPLTSGKKLMEFINKYPKSKLMPHIEAAYKGLLFKCSNENLSEELEKLAEQWLELHPNEITIMAYKGDAARKLGKIDKYIQIMIDIYKLEPSADLAKDIVDAYDQAKNTPKHIEWTEILFKYPEYDSDFMRRYNLLITYYSDLKDNAKAVEYAQKTLKSISLVVDPSEEIRKEMRDKRFRCYDFIAKNLLNQSKWGEAIKSFKQALRVQEYGEGYYQVGRCLHKENKALDAMLWYAKTIIWCGEPGRKCIVEDATSKVDIASKARENLEIIYRPLHDGTLIGLDKNEMKPAREQPESYWTSDN
jgi:tetratricopeptide (TPR) repeat protein